MRVVGVTAPTDSLFCPIGHLASAQLASKGLPSRILEIVAALNRFSYSTESILTSGLQTSVQQHGVHRSGTTHRLYTYVGGARIRIKSFNHSRGKFQTAEATQSILHGPRGLAPIRYLQYTTCQDLLQDLRCRSPFLSLVTSNSLVGAFPSVFSPSCMRSSCMRSSCVLSSCMRDEDWR